MSVVSHPKAFLIENNSVPRKNLQIRKYLAIFGVRFALKFFLFSFIFIFTIIKSNVTNPFSPNSKEKKRKYRTKLIQFVVKTA